MTYQTSWTAEKYRVYQREYQRKKRGVVPENYYISDDPLPRKVRMAKCSSLEEYIDKTKIKRTMCTCGLEIFDTEKSRTRHMKTANHELYLKRKMKLLEKEKNESSKK